MAGPLAACGQPHADAHALALGPPVMGGKQLAVRAEPTAVVGPRLALAPCRQEAAWHARDARARAAAGGGPRAPLRKRPQPAITSPGSSGRPAARRPNQRRTSRPPPACNTPAGDPNLAPRSPGATDPASGRGAGVLPSGGRGPVQRRAWAAVLVRLERRWAELVGAPRVKSAAHDWPAGGPASAFGRMGQGRGAGRREARRRR